MMSRLKTSLRITALATALLGGSASAAYAATICFNGTNILGITTPSSFSVCQGKSRTIQFTVKTAANYSGTTSLSTSSCALGILNVPNVQIVNGVGQVVTTATGSTGLAPGTYNCTVSVATPNPSLVPTGAGCSDQFIGSTTTFAYTLKRANLCN